MIRVDLVVESAQIYRFRMARQVFGRPAYYTAAYWLDGLLVDTGCAHTARQLTSALKSLPVQQIVNTHSHEDHIGANASIQAMFNCPIRTHPEALPILANPRLQRLQPYRRLFWGWPRPSDGQPIGEWVETQHYRFQVIPTPGHSPDHVCLLEPNRGWLFSGDAYIGGQDRALRVGYDIQAVIASLELLAQMPVDTIFSGSGSVRSEGVDHLTAKIAYLKDLGERVHALHDRGMSARRIRRTLFGRELPITYVTLGHFSGLHLVRSYLHASPPASPSPGPEVETDGQ